MAISSDTLINWLLKKDFWHYLWIPVLASVAMSECIVVVMSLMILGHLDSGYLITGLVASALVSLVISAILIYLSDYIRKREENLREAQRLAHFGNWELDIRSNRLTWSEEVYRIFEMDPKQFGASYENFLKVVHPEDRENVDFVYRNSVRTETPYEITHRLLMSDGSVKYVHESCTTSYDPDGKPLRSTGTVQDVTFRIASELALKESEERFSLIGTAAKDAIIISDPVEAVSYWNPAAEEIFGYSSNDVLGQNLHELLTPPSIRDLAHRGYKEFLISGQGNVIGKTLETTALRKSGEEFPVELSISAVKIKGQWNALGIVRDISERKKAEEQIRTLAYYDTLTGLPNRRLLADRLSQALTHAKRYSRALAIMFLDLDHFKKINDTLGHDVGDELLKEVAARISACVRSGDTVSRQGGDEFVIILSEIAHSEDAAQVARKIIEAIHKPIFIAGHELIVTTSIGISVYPVSGEDDARELMKKADIAMYEAKKAGRNRFSIFENQ